MNVDRYYVSQKLKPFGNLSKPVKLESKSHMEWVAQRPCYVTGHVGEDNDVHHVQKKSQIRNDYLTVSIRHQLHMQYHNQGIEYFQAHYRVIESEALIATLVERIIYLEDQMKEMASGRSSHSSR